MELYNHYDCNISDLLEKVISDNEMKELHGIERRLFDLEKRLNEAKKIANCQKDMAQVHLFFLYILM